MSDQRLRGLPFELRGHTEVLQHLARERADATGVLNEPEIAYLQSVSYGVLLRDVATEQDTTLNVINEVRRNVLTKLGTFTTAQSVYVALRDGVLAYEDLADELPYDPPVLREFSVLCMSALGFNHVRANRLFGSKRRFQTGSSHLLGRWGLPGIEVAIRRTYEERLWIARPKPPVNS